VQQVVHHTITPSMSPPPPKSIPSTITATRYSTTNLKGALESYCLSQQVTIFLSVVWCPSGGAVATASGGGGGGGGGQKEEAKEEVKEEKKEEKKEESEEESDEDVDFGLFDYSLN